MQQGKLKWIWGPVILIATLVMMLFAAAPIQMALGLWGVAITEVLILALAVAFCLVLRWPLKEVFRFRKPRVRQIIGTVLMGIGGFVAANTSVLVVFYFFPEGMAVSDALTGLYQSLPLPLAWFIMAVMPAVCEEALHRGAIQYSFSRWRSKWAVVLVMGLLFGLFHMDPYRFMPTAILGVVLSYIMWQTDNLWLPILYHMLNNSVSVLSSELAPEGATSAGVTIDLVTVGVYLILAAGALFVLRAGARLLGPRPVVVRGCAPAESVASSEGSGEPAGEAEAPEAPEATPAPVAEAAAPPRRGMGRIVTAVAAVLLVAVGAMLIAGSGSGPAALSSIQQVVEPQGNLYQEMPIVDIEEPGTYVLSVKVVEPTESGNVKVTVFDEFFQVLWEGSGAQIDETAVVEMSAGEHFYSFEYDYPADFEGSFTLTVEVR